MIEQQARIVSREGSGFIHAAQPIRNERRPCDAGHETLLAPDDRASAPFRHPPAWTPWRRTGR